MAFQETSFWSCDLCNLSKCFGRIFWKFSQGYGIYMPKVKEITQLLNLKCPSSDVSMLFLYIFSLSEVLMVRFQKGTHKVPVPKSFCVWNVMKYKNSNSKNNCVGRRLLSHIVQWSMELTTAAAQMLLAVSRLVFWSFLQFSQPNIRSIW